jgi:hypothetical protein
MKRLFEVATAEEWAAADFADHLDLYQALRHLASGEDEYVRITVTSERFRAKQQRAYEFARRMGISIQVRYRDGIMLMKNVTDQRKKGKSRRRIERSFQ